MPLFVSNTLVGGTRGSTGPRTVSVLARLGARDPLGATALVGEQSVERARHLERDERPVGTLLRPQERCVQRGSFLAHQSFIHLDARLSQLVCATAGLGRGVPQRQHHTGYARPEDRVGARRCLPRVIARFEAHHHGGARGIGAIAERRDFGVRFPILRVIPLPDHLTVAQQHRTHERVGRDSTPAPPGEGDRARHRTPLRGVPLRQRALQRPRRRGPPSRSRCPPPAPPAARRARRRTERPRSSPGPC